MSTQKPGSIQDPTASKPAVREPGKPQPEKVRGSAPQQNAPTQRPAGQSAQRAPQQAQQDSKGEHGEGNYKATRDYNDGLKRHLQTHDVDKEARDAAPTSPEEAADMDRAEQQGRAHARTKGFDDGEANNA
ncbi:MAG: hypothetical protein ABI440_08290 [Casimicrobiaceae bacterium]